MEFDLNAVSDITLTGKNIPGGSIALNAGDYRIEWVIMNNNGSARTFTIDNFQEAIDMTMRVYPY